MKFTPSSSARLSTACEVLSSILTWCMNDCWSASPNVIAPRQSSDTFTPVAPSLRYFMAVKLSPLGTARQCGATVGGSSNTQTLYAMHEQAQKTANGAARAAQVCDNTGAVGLIRAKLMLDAPLRSSKASVS